MCKSLKSKWVKDFKNSKLFTTIVISNKRVNQLDDEKDRLRLNEG